MNSAQFITEEHEYSKGKVCGKCNEHQPLSEFTKRTDSKDGLRHYCKSCVKEYDDNVCRFKVWFIAKRARSKRLGIEFTIKPEDIPGVKIRETITIDKFNRKYTSWEAIEYPKVCYKWGIELDWGMNGIQYNSPSLDRIDPTKGYVPGNVRLVRNSYNMAKLNCPPDIWDVVEKQIGRAILFGDNK